MSVVPKKLPHTYKAIMKNDSKKPISQMRRCQKRVNGTGLMISPCFYFSLIDIMAITFDFYKRKIAICYFLISKVITNDEISDTMANMQNNDTNKIDGMVLNEEVSVTASLKTTIDVIEIIEMYRYNLAMWCRASLTFRSETFFIFLMVCFFFINTPFTNYFTCLLYRLVCLCYIVNLFMVGVDKKQLSRQIV